MSSLSSKLLPVPEIDLLSDISEEDPLGETEQTTLDSLELLSTGDTSEQGDSDVAPLDSVLHPRVASAPAPERPHRGEAGGRSPACGHSALGLCRCALAGLPSLLDEDGYLVFPSLPKVWVSFLPADVQHWAPIHSPSFLPALVLLFALLLSASQSLPLALTCSLPLALSLCYLEVKATAPSESRHCDPSDRLGNEEAGAGVLT